MLGIDICVVDVEEIEETVVSLNDRAILRCRAASRRARGLPVAE